MKQLTIKQQAPQHLQKGVATFLISLVILILITFITIYTSKNILTEQKLVNNDQRTRNAFEAAEAGLARAITNISKDPDLNGNGILDGTATETALFDTTNDGNRDTNQLTIGTHSVTVTVADRSTKPGIFDIITISAAGLNDDGTATRTVSRTITLLDPIPGNPEGPMTARGSVVINGAATITNQEGHTTIWSGGDIDLGSNNSTATNVADVSGANYPVCMETPLTCSPMPSSNKVTMGLDVIEQDFSLGNLTVDEFFEYHFGMPPSTYKNTMANIVTTAADAYTDTFLQTDKIIWIEGNTVIDTDYTVGCVNHYTGLGNVCPEAEREPCLVIVNGNLTINTSAKFYGALYVVGELNLSGATEIMGALIGAANVNTTSGSLNVVYNSDLLSSTIGTPTYASAAGSWTDL